MRRSSLRRTPRKKTPVRDEYAERFSYDEILFTLGARLYRNGFIGIERSGQQEPGEIHHIFKLGGRHDCWTNLIGVNAAGHDGRHNGMRGEGGPFTVLCLMAKLSKAAVTGNALEFNPFRLIECAGHYILPTIQAVKFEDEFLETRRRQLESLISEIETGR